MNESLQKFQDRIDSDIDQITGLLQRRYFMKELTIAVKKHFPRLAEGVLPDDGNLVVLVGDLAFLSYFNAISHNTGNAVLSRVGTILHKYFEPHGAAVGRIGGDEFAVFMESSPDKALQIKEEISAEVKEEDRHILDIEFATVSDVRDLEKLILLPDELRVKWVVNALVDIAMARAQIVKYYARIGYLSSVYVNDQPFFKLLINHARKGAANITDAELMDFVRRMESGEDISLDCLKFAIQRKQENMTKEGQYETAIFTVAVKMFG